MMLGGNRTEADVSGDVDPNVPNVPNVVDANVDPDAEAEEAEARGDGGRNSPARRLTNSATPNARLITCTRDWNEVEKNCGWISSSGTRGR